MYKYKTVILGDAVPSGTVFIPVGSEQVFTAFKGSALIEGAEIVGGPFQVITNLTTGVPFPTSRRWVQIRATGAGEVIMTQLVQDHIISGVQGGGAPPQPPPPWTDLRLGGDALTIGEAAGLDVRHNATMVVTRTAAGLVVGGPGEWAKWVKFETLTWTRGDNRDLEIITLTPGARHYVVGVGRTDGNESAVNSFNELTAAAYASPSPSSVKILYGQTALGAGTNVPITPIVFGAATVFKYIIKGDGAQGQNVEIYSLPSAAIADWDDTATLLGSATITAPIDPQSVSLVPQITNFNANLTVVAARLV